VTNLRFPTHPGTITFYDANTDTVLKTAKAADVPESLRFAPGPDGTKIPVVKVVYTTTGERRFVREYGTEGQMLRSTVQVKR
jgi:hypothetical protein